MTVEEEKQEEALQPTETAVTGTEEAADATAEPEDAAEKGGATTIASEVDISEESSDEDLKAGKKKIMTVAADAPWKDRMWEVFSTFWPLGLIAFGGPQAHVAILRDHLVVQRDWLDEEQFTELFAIGQVRISQRFNFQHHSRATNLFVSPSIHPSIYVCNRVFPVPQVRSLSFLRL
jgi:hypothetical protein